MMLPPGTITKSTTITHVLDIYNILPVLLLLLVRCISGDLSTSSPLPEASTSPDLQYPDPDVMAHFNEPYDFRMKEKLFIDIMDASPSSLHVKWSLTNTSFSDSLVEATVICETEKGTIVSDKVVAPSNSFKFEFLQSNTHYIVCVYLLEQSASTNIRYLHYTCRPAKTIPLVRYDSIVGVVLALGYIFLMGGIGFATWWLKRKRIRQQEEDRRRIADAESDDFEEINVDPHDFARFGVDSSNGIEVNGGAANKPKDSKNRSLACCTKSNVKFSDIPEEETIQLNVKGREISF